MCRTTYWVKADFSALPHDLQAVLGTIVVRVFFSLSLSVGVCVCVCVSPLALFLALTHVATTVTKTVNAENAKIAENTEPKVKQNK